LKDISFEKLVLLDNVCSDDSSPHEVP